MSHHSQYLFQVVPLFLQCQGNLKMTLSRIHFSPGRYESLYRLQRSLRATEQLLWAYVVKILRERNNHNSSSSSNAHPEGHPPWLLLSQETTRTGNCNHGDLLRALEYLKLLASDNHNNSSSSSSSANEDSVSSSSSRSGASSCLRNPQEATIRSFYTNTTHQSQGAESQLLFRLIVIFQLLLVRIDDAHFVITGYRIQDESFSSSPLPPSPTKGGGTSDSELPRRVSRKRVQHSSLLPSLGVCCLGTAGMIAGFLGRKQLGSLRTTVWPFLTHCSKRQLIGATAKVGSSLLGFYFLNGFLNVCWMSDKIIRSNNELLEWNHQWDLIDCVAERSSMVLQNGNSNRFSSSPSVGPRPPTPSLLTNNHNNNHLHDGRMTEGSSSACPSILDMDEKSKTLIEYAQKHGRKSYFWRSTGEIRFLMVKRFMDIYYASVGVGVHCTKDHSFFLPLVAGAAASFYTITGAPTPTVVNDASSRDLIQHAWGMVSLPVLKDLMLQASRLVKGASVADRIVLCGVPCFILSKDPAPELAAALQRQAKVRSGDSSANLSQLSTIAETEIHLDDGDDAFQPVSRRKSFAGTKGQYRQRDVILHLTGGGFFAHTIASDLPYLLDWSSCTGSVVICPEYSLLPEHQFPTQLHQIAMIYSALASGNTGEDLGFDANSIIVTGESAGGNLAAALCVQLAQQNIDAESRIGDATGESSQSQSPSSSAAAQRLDAHSQSHSDTDAAGNSDSSGLLPNTRMPDAIMLSCPALNLTTELSHSRVVGTEDPVLPNALISAISEAYLPPGIDNKDSLVSPFYASDCVLRRFPPTLLFASSKDPLLDDSVTFNERLRVLGVDSELMAVHNVPHAYLGLGTAGFPEAVQVQQYAMDWLSSKFS